MRSNDFAPPLFREDEQAAMPRMPHVVMCTDYIALRGHPSRSFVESAWNSEKVL